VHIKQKRREQEITQAAGTNSNESIRQASSFQCGHQAHHSHVIESTCISSINSSSIVNRNKIEASRQDTIEHIINIAQSTHRQGNSAQQSKQENIA
jgi:hypothetical protein